MLWKLACEDETTIPPFIRRIRNYATRLQVGHGGRSKSHALSHVTEASVCMAISQAGSLLLTCVYLDGCSRRHSHHIYSWLVTRMLQCEAPLPLVTQDRTGHLAIALKGLLQTMHLGEHFRTCQLHTLPSSPAAYFK